MCTRSRQRDRLSNLPDEIRFKIVSFLSLEAASRITILSRKWRQIVSSFSNLTFKRVLFPQLISDSNKEYRDFINHILDIHNESSIEKFTITTNIDGINITESHLRDWVSFAATHKVKDLHLSFCPIKFKPHYSKHNVLSHVHELPDCIHSCTTLSVLSLAFIKLSHPVCFSFPLLESLTLTIVQIVGDESIQEFSLCCDNTSLETLVIDCVIHAKPLNISGANVKCLTLTGTEGHDPIINLSMPSLVEFQFKGHRAVNIGLEAMQSVRKAGFYPQRPLSTVVIDWRTLWANSLTMGICNLEMLTLSTFDIELHGHNQLLEGDIPIPYYSIKHLTFKSSIEDYQVNLMSFILKRFPNLHTLVIHRVNHSSKFTQVENGNGWLLGEQADGDALKNVKNVEIYSFRGSEAELNLVKYLFYKASVLESVNIYYTPCSDDKYKMISAQVMLISKTSDNIVTFQQHNKGTL